MLLETCCLYYLLPDKRDVSVTGRLRQARTFEPLKYRTVKFRNSFIPYRLTIMSRPLLVNNYIPKFGEAVGLDFRIISVHIIYIL